MVSLDFTCSYPSDSLIHNKDNALHSLLLNIVGIIELKLF